MKRRDFLGVLSGAAAWPFAARAQQPAMPVIGFLSSGSPELSSLEVDSFRIGLNEFGYVESRNMAIEFRWAGDQNDRLPALAADLVRRQVAVIVAPNNAAVLAAKTATATIPIVFIGSIDPVAFGLVTSLNRPGGNITGVTTLNLDLGPKRVELLHELLPTARTMALLVNPTNPAAGTDMRLIEQAARTFGLQLHVLHASTESEFMTAIASIPKLQASALAIAADRFFNTQSEQLAALALRHAVPAIYQYRAFAAAGGLMSYGSAITESYRLAGLYTGQILKGAKPTDLPVQQVTKVELIINLKTAKMLGLEVPLSLLARAAELIE
jgi:putative ABC transport system substrate-binding protein